MCKKIYKRRARNNKNRIINDAGKKAEFNKNIREIEMEEKMIKDIKETMEDLSEDEEILNYFDYEQDALALKNGEISEAKEKAFKEGIIEGIVETAEKMKKENFDLKTISKITGLTKEEL
ncbi:MAG: hypothetical protein NC181_03275 [Clostridium sp.]|nr:hypothetical protein [Clostridium sp.]MCM1444312.1 hypothetical protein [Candidatus Amulumruptor caecigallinarius]